MVQTDNQPFDPEAEGLPDYVDDQTDADGRVTADGPESAPLPHDTPQALDRFGITAEEARQGESVAYKLAREQPEAEPASIRRDLGGPAIEPNLDSPVSVYDRADLHLDPGRPIGRLVEPDEGVRPDDEADAVAYESGPAAGPTAEEAAMHELDDTGEQL